MAANGNCHWSQRKMNVRKLGLEFLGAFGLPPVELVNLAADLDCQFISTVMTPIDYNPEGFPSWSLRDDANLRRDLKAALRERNVKLTLGEGFLMAANIDVRQAYAGDLDIYRDLGVERINSLSFDPDLSRTFDQFAALTEMAAERGLEPVLEFVPISVVGNLATAVEAVKHAGGPAKVLVDTMHFFRSGTSIADLKAAPAELIGHVQLCDAPSVPTISDYLEEAMYERMVPGEGDAPLVEILAAVSSALSVGLEVPLRALAEQGVGVRQRMAKCVAGAREVFARADRL